MRHSVRTDRFGRFSSYRKATIRSLVVAVLRNEKVTTTKAKAKTARRAVEKIITLGKHNTLADRRRAFAFLCDHHLVRSLFTDIAPKFKERKGGYTRVLPLRNRRGDNAQLVVLELTERYKMELQKTAEKAKEKDSRMPKLARFKRKKQEDIAVPEANKQDQDVRGESVADAEVTQAPQAEKPEATKQEASQESDRKQDDQGKKKILGGFKGLFRKKKDKQ